MGDLRANQPQSPLIEIAPHAGLITLGCEGMAILRQQSQTTLTLLFCSNLFHSRLGLFRKMLYVFNREVFFVGDKAARYLVTLIS